ncbi:hypothetical protein PRIPAC_73239 [Pristionchus pacificus]|uniref:Uncharacterized protein n=1 Tax=Pristionchus pacificus TaxID=54126 RepID=A0A2A6BRD1_PRIPA|nr:hypothetical protein PRIPAC_73239 [Pristionchus pacificus]|eukprot:PDM68489.1 hypothetical protein PRIPAC_43991 [Pristionchus pacificus]
MRTCPLPIPSSFLMSTRPRFMDFPTALIEIHCALGILGQPVNHPTRADPKTLVHRGKLVSSTILVDRTTDAEESDEQSERETPLPVGGDFEAVIRDSLNDQSLANCYEQPEIPTGEFAPVPDYDPFVMGPVEMEQAFVSLTWTDEETNIRDVISGADFQDLMDYAHEDGDEVSQDRLTPVETIISTHTIVETSPIGNTSPIAASFSGEV